MCFLLTFLLFFFLLLQVWVSLYFFFGWNGGWGLVVSYAGCEIMRLFIQHCFMQSLWFIASCFFWMWLLLEKRGLVGTLHPVQVSHSMHKAFSLLFKKTIFLPVSKSFVIKRHRCFYFQHYQLTSFTNLLYILLQLLYNTFP